MVYDFAIIGGGVIGCSILNKLTRLGYKCLLIEKGSDVAVGTSKANSGIVHAGFDAKRNSLKARLNVTGAELFPKLCEELHVPYKKNSAVVIGNDLNVVKELYNRGVDNGVKELEILDRDKLYNILPCISDNITCALYAKNSAIVSPYKFTIALAEHSVINGADVVLNYTINKVSKTENVFSFTNGETEYSAKKIILAVGTCHNEVAKLFGSKEYDIKFRLGEYYLLDRDAIDISGLTIFPLPSKESKGVLVTPTVDNNIIVGPTSTLTDSDSALTTSDGLKDIASRASSMLTNIDLKKNIRVFSGVRTLVGDDFIIEKDEHDSDIINVTGICSPGLSSAPAIAEYVVELLNLQNTEKKMKGIKKLESLKDKSIDEVNKLIKSEPRYGKIICRCEMVSEMEIINAINSPLRPMSIDAIKRRTRAGMGRCQGGFCFSKVMEIVSKQCNISIDEVIKENSGSRIIVGDIE